MAWTQEEIDEYAMLRKHELGPLYAAAKIPTNEPEKRARYLAEDVLNLTATDHDVIMTMATSQGKAKSLVMLESMVLAAFY